MQNLTIQNVLQNRGSYNLALPFVETQQVTPFYKQSVLLLYVDPNGRDVYKVGSNNLGNGRWEDLYSLAKPFLNKLATEAGIQFSPGSGDVVKMDENTWKASAFGAVKLPDGNLRTSNNFKVIDLVTIEKKYRLSYEEKAEKGIFDFKAAKDAARRYAGEWHEKVNEEGHPIKYYIVARGERERYIEKSLNDAMTQYRADAPQKAATGAILRVIRDILGIKGTYTAKELKKPFAVARMSFSPNYNDPVMKQMLLQQAIQSVGNLFGNTQPVMQTISIPQAADDEIDMPADIYEDASVQPVLEQNQNGQPDSRKNRQRPEEPASREMTEKDRSQDFCCDKCGRVIPKKVWEYSYENMGQPLCFACQKAVKNRQGGRR